MPVTTRDYLMPQATPQNVINALETAISDLGWHDDERLGYVLTFANTAGVTIYPDINKRYLCTQSATSGSGTGAVFDILRSATGTVSAVTLVTGGEGYKIIGTINSSSSGTTVTVPDTTGIVPGMIVTKIAGTGTLLTNTVVASVTNSTTLVLNVAPSLALSAAVLQFADTITLPGSQMGGTSYTTTGSATSGSTSLTVADGNGIKAGQVVSGAGITPGTVVSSVAGLVVTLSIATVAAISATNVTFDDGIFVTLSSIANTQGITGTTSGVTITNVANTNNIFVGARITVSSGPTLDTSGGEVFIGSITGTGPYTLTLRNNANTFRGFNTGAAITFKASRGGTTKWWGGDVFTTPATACYGVAAIQNSTGRLGHSYWAFYADRASATVSTTLYIRAGSGYNSSANQFQGVSTLDWFSVQGVATTASYMIPVTASSPYLNVPVTLRVRQSSEDTNFAIFSFMEGTVLRGQFFISKYNNSIQPWSLNDVWLGGAYAVVSGAYNTNDAFLQFRCRMTGQPRRMAEAGYGNHWQTDNTTIGYTNLYFHTSSGNRLVASPGNNFDNICFYSRNQFELQTSLSTVAIFKNIPINPSFAPVPYYLPNDFILAEIQGFNVQIGDTITVTAGTEVYTIINTSINSVTFTAMVLAARTT